jgi:folate-binding protein YgfZ
MRELLLGLNGAGATATLFGEEIALGWGDPERERRALREGVGVLPAPWERLCLVTGKDRSAFLHAMLTQDVLHLPPSHCRPAALADRKGHLVADVWLLNLGDRLGVRVRSDRLGPFFDVLDRHRIAEKVDWRAVDTLECFLLAGPRAGRALESIGVRYVEGESEGGRLPGSESEGFWMRVRETGKADFLIATLRSETASTWKRLLASIPEAQPVGWEAFNHLRIEAGSPWFGLDGDESRLVPEILPGDRISYSKGCFLGQETIARLHYVGQLNWRIGRIRFPGVAPPGPGADLLDSEGGRVGWCTSASPDPNGGAVGLAYLHRRFRESRGPLSLAGGAAAQWLGEIADQPEIA